MRIAIIIGELGAGGAERAAQLLGDYLIEQGHQIYYFVFDTTEIKTNVRGTIVNVGVDIEEFAMASGVRFCFDRALIANASKIKKQKRAYSIDIAISFMEDSNYLNILSRYKEKVIVSVRTAISYRTDLPDYAKNVHAIKKLYPKANKVVAVSDFVKKDLIENYGLKGNIVTVISNPAIKKFIDVANSEYKGKYKRIVCVARLDPVKQHDRIIRAFSVVAEKANDARLVLVGDGKLKSYLMWLADKYSVLNRIDFVGYSKNVAEHLIGARAFVMASRAEGFPNAMVEAMAFGVPIISTDSPGGCGEILGKKENAKGIEHCEFGVLTPYIVGKAPVYMELEKEEVDLGRAMLQLIDDDEIFEKYSVASLRRANKYSYENEMSKWERILAE